MFSSISWQQYLIAVFVVLVIYYVIVVPMYYRAELLAFSLRVFQKRKTASHEPLPAAISPEAQASVLSSSVYELVEELNALFHKAAHQRYPKEELCMALQIRLSNYTTLKGTTFQHSIIDHIRSETKACCNISLEDFEIAQLW
jgi:hypothetical protein